MIGYYRPYLAYKANRKNVTQFRKINYDGYPRRAKVIPKQAPSQGTILIISLYNNCSKLFPQ